MLPYSDGQCLTKATETAEAVSALQAKMSERAFVPGSSEIYLLPLLVDVLDDVGRLTDGVGGILNRLERIEEHIASASLAAPSAPSKAMDHHDIFDIFEPLEEFESMARGPHAHDGTGHGATIKPTSTSTVHKGAAAAEPAAPEDEVEEPELQFGMDDQPASQYTPEAGATLKDYSRKGGCRRGLFVMTDSW